MMAALSVNNIIPNMDFSIQVMEGGITGKLCNTFEGTKYFSFEGIPYAKPPIGELRFKNPQPPDKWANFRDCTKPGDMCAQLNPLSSKGFEGSEDCLYLNVYTPCLPSEEIKKLPVLLFIHGGRLMIGYGDYYRPDYYMKHDVILVTINYRLNILGFLCLDIPEVPGNAGMKDCAMALKWVRSNIHSFNGDMNNITVYGESAGAALATSFLMSQMTVGLYDKIIAQSGNNVADVFFHRQDHIAIARHIASLMGKELKDKTSLYNFFKSVAVEDLVQAYTMADFEKAPYIISPILLPVVEKEFEGVERFISEEPKESLRFARFAKVPIIAGSNMFEGAVFLRGEGNGVLYENDFKFFVPPSLYLEESDQKAVRIAKQIKRFYFQDETVGDSTKLQFIKLLSDAYFQRDIILFAESVSRVNNKFYAYNFHYQGNLNIKTMNELGIKGTTHGDSVQYQFYNRNKANKATLRDKAIIDFFSEAWCNFAKNGIPSWSGQDVQWLPYTPKGKLTLIIDDKMRLATNEDWTNYTFWREISSEKNKL